MDSVAAAAQPTVRESRRQQVTARSAILFRKLGKRILEGWEWLSSIVWYLGTPLFINQEAGRCRSACSEASACRLDCGSYDIPGTENSCNEGSECRVCEFFWRSERSAFFGCGWQLVAAC